MVSKLPPVPRLEQFVGSDGRLTREAQQWLQPMLDALNRVNGAVLSGTGSPAGVVAAPVGTMYLRTDGGASTTVYVKESGTDTSGWTAK